MSTMLALQKDAQGVALVRVPIPELQNDDDVRVRVSVAGICRTDLLVAEGRLPSREPVILGHEFAGMVDALAPEVAELSVGQRVAINPLFACGTCVICMTGDTINCPYRTMLGVEQDGAFAEYVVVPAQNIVRVPNTVSELQAAYLEPIAAALGVLNADITPNQHGIILGRNRFATLLHRLLHATGFNHVVTYDPASAESVTCDTFDYAIETNLTAAIFAEMIRVVKPRGLVILKSRTPNEIALHWLPAVIKQLHLQAVNYGPFARAVQVLAEGRLNLDGLFGRVYSLRDFEAAFAEARHGETAKIFLKPD